MTGELGTLREYGSLSGPGVLASFGYDDLGRRTALVRGNGAATYYGYDPVSRLAAMTHAFPNSAANDLGIGSIAYNPAGQIVGLTRSNDAYAWTGNGSGTTATTVNGINQLADISGAGSQFAYDGRGNMTFDPVSGRWFGYSSENELVATSDGYGYGHDMFSRIIDTAASGAVTRQFVHDGPEIVATVTPGVGLTERYVRGDGADELLVEYAGSDTSARTWLHADERGSIVARSDSGGNVTAINRYDEYGKPQAGNVGRFQYTGQMWLPEIGLYHYKNRAYAPHLGRFMQTDPIGYGDGMNMYAYVGNDPVNWTDPLGLSTGDILVTGSPWCVRQFSQCAARPELGEGFSGGPANSPGSGVSGPRPATGGKPNPKPQKPKRPDEKKSPCNQVADQPGKVFVDFLSASFVPGIGVSGSVGVFTNLSTGSGGFFYTTAGNYGFEAGAGLSGGFYRSAADLRGINVNINVSAGVSGSANFSASGRLVGGSLGQSGKLGGSISLSNTTFFGCYYNGG